MVVTEVVLILLEIAAYVVIDPVTVTLVNDVIKCSAVIAPVKRESTVIPPTLIANSALNVEDLK